MNTALNFEADDQGPVYTVYDAVARVKHFHEKMQIDQVCPIQTIAEVAEELKNVQHVSPELNEFLTSLENMVESTKALRKFLKDRENRQVEISTPAEVLLTRVQLQMEETLEFVTALGDGDPIETFDAIGDLFFILMGHCVALRKNDDSSSLPIYDIINEVIQSNLTKKPAADGSLRLTDKGSGFIPPNMGMLYNSYAKAKVSDDESDQGSC